MMRTRTNSLLSLHNWSLFTATVVASASLGMLVAGCTGDGDLGTASGVTDAADNGENALVADSTVGQDSIGGEDVGSGLSDTSVALDAGSAPEVSATPDAGGVPAGCGGRTDGAACGGKGHCDSGHCVWVGAQGRKMVHVTSGSFWMGCNEAKDKECDSDEKPQHKVALSSYWIGMYEVTVADYGKCHAAGKCPAPGDGNNCEWGVSGSEQRPVNCVAWSQARAYCQWRGTGYDLPTEAQWEKAARGGCEFNGGAIGCKSGMRTFPWGETAPNCDLAVREESVVGCDTGSAWPVGSKPNGLSPYGAHDLAGNAWEWVLDWHDDGYYASSPENDPANLQASTHRVLRGGSWGHKDDYLRASKRGHFNPDWAGFVTGFRCAMQ